jgi:signal transduction histidine kinase
MEDAELRAGYRTFNSRQLARGLMVLNAISVLIVPGGCVLDYFVYPAHFVEFLILRCVCAVILVGLLGLLYRLQSTGRLALIKCIGVFSAVLVNATMCYMIYLTDGARSPYFVGMILVLTCWSIASPWTAVETTAMCLVSLGIFILACVANPGFSQEGAAPLLGFGSFFVVITSIACVGITFFLSGVRFQDFRLRHQLDRQNQELQDMDRMKTQFFANISHELRTPLTLILGPTEALLSRPESLDAKVHEGLLMIHRNTLRLLKLINDLLELTRLDQGADVLRTRPVEIGTFVRGIVDSVRHLGLTKNLRIRVEEGPADLVIDVDPVRIEKVIVNLLTNAIKYTPAGGTVTVRWSQDATETVIEVEDTGVGIPAEDLPKIFDRFHQVRGNEANLTQGVGIGLALVRELVELHGGKIQVKSAVGRGSTFRIALPVKRTEVSSDPAGQALTSPPESEEPFEKAFRAADRSWRNPTEQGDLPKVGRGDRVVLVADDEPDVRKYVVSLLAEEYRVVQTQHGGNVAALVAAHRPSLVILDWMMPDKDGLAVCRELRADPACQDLKIILLTARIDERSKIEALQSGADDFLTKPFSSIEVKTRVANLIRVAELQRDLRGRNEELAGTIEKLQRTEAMLVQSEKMNAIGSLSAGLLHEINNPLNYTLTAISFAGQFRDTLNDDMKEILSDIEEGMVRIRDVVTDLKNFAYPEKPGTETEFALAEVLRSAQKIVAREIENAELEVDLPENLVVRGQKTQLMHVFINLLNNAGHALRQGPVHGRPSISVRGRVEEEMVVVEVADNGPGVPPEIMNRIFEPFFTTRDVGAGMGMGLSICHTILESHQGSIRVGNRAEGGAIFTLTLPLAQEAQKSC